MGLYSPTVEESDCVGANNGLSNEELEGLYGTREPFALLSAGVPDMYQGEEASGIPFISFY